MYIKESLTFDNTPYSLLRRTLYSITTQCKLCFLPLVGGYVEKVINQVSAKIFNPPAGLEKNNLSQVSLHPSMFHPFLAVHAHSRHNTPLGYISSLRRIYQTFMRMCSETIHFITVYWGVIK